MGDRFPFARTKTISYYAIFKTATVCFAGKACLASLLGKTSCSGPGMLIDRRSNDG